VTPLTRRSTTQSNHSGCEPRNQLMHKLVTAIRCYPIFALIYGLSNERLETMPCDPSCHDVTFVK